MRYMPLNYAGDSCALAWCEMFKIMRPNDVYQINETENCYDPSNRSDLFPYCRNNDNAALRAAREAVIARNPGVEAYIKQWGFIPPEHI